MGRMDWAQVSLSLFADQKVRRLFHQQEELVARAAMGLWLDVLLTSWAEESREPADEVILDAEACKPLVEALQAAKLLDTHARIPEKTWDRWWGRVEERRASDRQRQQARRASTGVTAGHDVSHVTPVDSTVTSPSPSLSNSLEEESVRGGDALLEAAVVALGTISPTPKAMDWVDEMAEAYGQQPTITALMEAHKQGGSQKVLSRAQGILDRAKLEAGRNEKQRKQQELEEAKRHRRARIHRPSPEALADVRPLAELMPEVAQRLGKGGADA